MTRARASSTAILIAACLLIHGLSGAKTECVPNESLLWARRFLNLTARGRLLRILAEWRIGRLLARACEWVFLPGIVAHHAVRKADVERIVTDTLQHEPDSTLLVLGAGFDSLAARLRGRSLGVRHIELDHPGTQRVKRGNAAFASTGVELLEVDLASCSASDLVHHAGASNHSVIVVEGVLMYLQPHRVRELLQALAEVTSADATLILSFMDLVDGRPAFHRRRRLVAGILSCVGERMHWGVTPSDAAAFLASAGWTLQDLHAPSLPSGHPACPGEYAAVARKDHQERQPHSGHGRTSSPPASPEMS